MKDSDCSPGGWQYIPDKRSSNADFKATHSMRNEQGSWMATSDFCSLDISQHGTGFGALLDELT